MIMDELSEAVNTHQLNSVSCLGHGISAQQQESNEHNEPIDE